jgi:peptidoglycan/LPS O-acetylase OafA/YrhL
VLLLATALPLRAEMDTKKFAPPKRISDTTTSSKSNTAFPIPSYIPQFDGLRGISIIAVLIAHSGFIEALPHAHALEYGRVGVDLFFVLSGFLITGILRDSRKSPNYFRNFYMRRALRIWPLYYALLVVIFVISPVFVPSMWKTVGTVWPYFVFYIQNINYHLYPPFGLEPTWSLAIEEQFYLTWPLMVLYLRKRTLSFVLVTLVLMSLVMRISGYLDGAPLKFIHNFTFCRLDAIACGSLAAIWLRSSHCTLKLWRTVSISCLGLGLGGIVLSRMLFREQSTVVSYVFIAIGFTGVLSISLVSDPNTSAMGRVLTADWLCYIGKISYGIYLLHMPLFILITQFIVHRGLNRLHPVVGNICATLAEFVSAILAASISWRFFEKPILGFKKKFPSGSQMHWPAVIPNEIAN